MRITPDGYVGIGIAPTGGSYKLRGGGEGGVRAVVNGLNAIALHGESITGAGVVGNSTNGYGVLGTSTNSYAGYFSGNVYVTGTVTQNSDVRLKTTQGQDSRAHPRFFSILLIAQECRAVGSLSSLRSDRKLPVLGYGVLMDSRVLR